MQYFGWAKSRFSFLYLILLAGMAVFIGVQASTIVYQVFLIRDESEIAQKKVEELRRKKVELEMLLAELRTPEAVERRAKERFNVKKPGEKVVVIVSDEKHDVGEISESAPAHKNWWPWFKNFFWRR